MGEIMGDIAGNDVATMVLLDYEAALKWLGVEL
jgi:hypothetical protein